VKSIGDLNQTEQWFRTKLHEYLGYGIAGFSILSGWLHSNDSVISLHHAENAEKHEAAIALAIALPMVWAAWYLLLIGIHRRCPQHPTAMHPRRSSWLCARSRHCAFRDLGLGGRPLDATRLVNG